jgi:hypothetical protein
MDMKEFGSWIPQIFYDLIGRVVPGAFLLLIGPGLLVNPHVSVQVIKSADHIPTTILILLGLLMSYVLGTILGAVAGTIGTLLVAVAGAIKNRKWSIERVGSVKVEVVPLSSEVETLTPGRISYMYDALQLYNPSAGARLAKLRAEQHMCRVLIAGGIVLEVAYALVEPGALLSAKSLVVLVGLAVMVLGAYFFYIHLAIRGRRLLTNCWHLINLPATISEIEQRPR